MDAQFKVKNIRPTRGKDAALQVNEGDADPQRGVLFGPRTFIYDFCERSMLRDYCVRSCMGVCMWLRVDLRQYRLMPTKAAATSRPPRMPRELI